MTAAILADWIASPGTSTISVLNPTGDYSRTVNSASFPFTALAPSLSSMTPNSAIAGSPALGLTIAGSSFVANSQVQWGGTALSTTFLNGGQLTATVPANLLVTPGSANVSVNNGNLAHTAGLIFSVYPPSVSALAPASATAGTAGLTLSVTGANFLSNSQVYWNNTPLASRFVSSASLSASVPAILLTTAGSAAITVVNPGGTTSNGMAFSVYGPGLTFLNPASAAAGTSGLTLTVTGTGFLSNSAIQWNGNPLPTAFVSGTQLTAAVPDTLLAIPGTNSITVVNPGGATSGALTFTVSSVVPILSALSPQSISAGGPAFTLTVSGTGLLPGAKILWNSQPIDTNWISASQLSALIPASLISQPGAVSISVSTSAGTSNAVSFPVTSVGPYVTSAGIVNSASGTSFMSPGSLVSIFGANLSPTAASAGATPLPLVLAGTSVLVNGGPAPLLYVSPAQINIQLPYETPVGAATLTVARGSTSGDPVLFNVVANGPGVMTIPQTNHALAVNYSDGAVNSAQDPARPGDFLILYLTGSGAVDPPVPTGAVASSSPLSNAIASVIVTIGGQDAQVAFAGLTPGLVGVFQINVSVPAVATGEQVLQVTVGGTGANTSMVSIVND